MTDDRLGMALEALGQAFIEVGRAMRSFESTHEVCGTCGVPVEVGALHECRGADALYRLLNGDVPGRSHTGG